MRMKREGVVAKKEEEGEGREGGRARGRKGGRRR
jgi:hypothetical protein